MRQVNEIFSVILSREMNQLEVHFDPFSKVVSEKVYMDEGLSMTYILCTDRI